MKIYAQWYCVDTSYFTHNWETRGGWEHLIPSRTGPIKNLPTAYRWIIEAQKYPACIIAWWLWCEEEECCIWIAMKCASHFHCNELLFSDISLALDSTVQSANNQLARWRLFALCGVRNIGSANIHSNSYLVLIRDFFRLQFRRVRKFSRVP